MPILGSFGAAGARGLGLTASGGVPYNIDILVVAGGGSGASRWGGGGAGGGLVYKTTHEVITGKEYTVAHWWWRCRYSNRCFRQGNGLCWW